MGSMVDLILDDSFEDACTICLEPFSSLDPSSVTNCKHEYHLHCILEWSQRSYECPICSQRLILKDPASQELLAGVENDKNLRLKHTSHPVTQNNEVNYDSYQVDVSELEQRIMRQFSAVASRARSFSRKIRPSSQEVSPSQVVLPSVSNTTQLNNSSENQAFVSGNDSVRGPTFTRQASASFPSFGSRNAQNMQFRPVNPCQSPPNDSQISSSSELLAFSESLKSKISTASAKYKESISKSTRGLKEKLVARNDSVRELTRGVQREMTSGISGIARMIEKLDFTPKRTGVSVPRSSSTVGPSNSTHESKVTPGSIPRSIEVSVSKGTN